MNPPQTLRRIARWVAWFSIADAVLLERAAILYERMEHTLDAIVTDAQEQAGIDAERDAAVRDAVRDGRVARLAAARVNVSNFKGTRL